MATRANAGATVKMVSVIYQKAPYAVFSLRSGANVTKAEQLENLEIASGAGSFTQKVIEAFMTAKGLKPSTVKFVNIDPGARVGMLVSKNIPAIETFVYRARFFGHKFDLSGVLHGGFLPGETRLARAA